MDRLILLVFWHLRAWGRIAACIYAMCAATPPWVAAQARWLPHMQKSRVRVPGWQRLFIYALWAGDAQGVLPCEGWGVTASQLDLPSLTPLSVAGCGRLQLEAAHWATWVTLLQVVDNWPHKIVVVDSPLGGSRPKKTFILLLNEMCCLFQTLQATHFQTLQANKTIYKTLTTVEVQLKCRKNILTLQ